MVPKVMVPKIMTAARSGVATMVVVLPVFWSVGQLTVWWRPPLAALIFAVMLAVSLPRVLDTTPTRHRAAVALAYLVATAVAVGCGMLVADHGWRRAVGAVVFALAVAAPVWSRRLGRAWRSLGAAATVPLVAVLVPPVPAGGTMTFVGWMLLAAAIALAWALAVAWLRPPPDAAVEPAVNPAADPAAGPGAESGPGPSRARPAASTRMALQLAVAVAAAFAVAEVIDPNHLVWAVLTAVVVSTGNRGRGDVLWKGTQRLLGAAAGTAAATLLVGSPAPGDSRGPVVIFAVLAVAVAVRRFGYALWAAGITAGLAVLYGYLGQGGSELLWERLLGVVVGGAVAILAAFVILPIRTVDVVRLRTATTLAAAAAVLASSTPATPASSTADARSAGSAADPARPPGSVAGLRAALVELAALRPTARAAQRLGIGRVRQAFPLLRDTENLAGRVVAAAAAPVPDEEALAALRREVGQARLRLRASASSGDRGPAAVS